MGFVQIITYRTSHPEEVQALSEKWMAATEGKRTVLRELHCEDRDQAGRYMDIVEFESYESAMQNSELPETQEIAGQWAELCEELEFTNLDVVATY